MFVLAYLKLGEQKVFKDYQGPSRTNKDYHGLSRQTERQTVYPLLVMVERCDIVNIFLFCFV